MMSGDGRSLALALALIAIVVQQGSIQVHLISRVILLTLNSLPSSAHNLQYFVAPPISNYNYKA